MIGIYKITNNVNGKVYIGQAVDIEKRWREHRNSANNDNMNQVIYRAMRKYGVDNFTFEVIDECEMDELNNLEIMYISHYNSYIHCDNSNGYNMTLGGEATKGWIPSEENRKKMSENHSNFTGVNNPMYGKQHTEKVKRKISEANKHRQHSDETKRKISESQKGSNNPNFGKQFSEETKRKISEANKGLQAGSNNPRAKKVICDNMIFGCIKECAEYYNVNRRTMNDWLNGRRKIRIDFKQMGLSYIEEKEVA